VTHRYNINLFWSDEDQSWVADVPDLFPCSAFGDTPEQAAAEAQIVIGLWLESARDHGKTIPEPLYRPAIYAAPRAA
jgi:predicted RNase H-like HicB family nuclease